MTLREAPATHSVHGAMLNQAIGLRPHLAPCALIVLLCILVFGQVVNFDFVDFDDSLYITNSKTVLGGIGNAPLSASFGDFSQPMYVPLVTLGLMAQVEWFGTEPAAFHVTNAVLHALNSLLVYALCVALIRHRFGALIAAAVFAIHPMHIESVAWISGLKDVLSMFFWLAASLAYLRFVHARRWRWYFVAIVGLLLGLLSKPILVVFPFTLLLFDIGPLDRARTLRDIGRVTLEKLPMLALTVIFAVVAFKTQRESGAISEFDSIPFAWRVQNAVYAYAIYAVKFFVPTGLSVFHPHPLGTIGAGTLALSAALLVLMSILCLRAHDDRRWALFAWLWFLGTLVPVIGLVQIGGQSYAERYTYVAYLGPILALGALADFAQSRAGFRRIAAAAFAGTVLICALLSYRQTLTWRNTETLFGHAVAVDSKNAFAHLKLGWALRTKDPARAIAHHQAAAAQQLRNPRVYAQLGRVYSGIGDHARAAEQFWTRLSLVPMDAAAYDDLSVAYRLKGELEVATALGVCSRAIRDGSVSAIADSFEDAANIFRSRGFSAEAEYFGSRAAILKQ